MIRRLLLVLALGLLSVVGVGVDPAGATVTFDGSPGTGPPPATLGPYAMVPFGADPQPLMTNVVAVAAPGGGAVGLSPASSHRRVGNGWATWSHGYTGDVYWTNGATTLSMTLPAGTRAFAFYAEPNARSVFQITATTDSGATSGPVNVNGNAGARYFGFYATGGDALASIVVASSSDFGVGEFAIATNQDPDCSAVAADPATLWPPNHEMRAVRLSGATDPDGDTTTLTVAGVGQDEPTDDRGDGSRAPDAATGSSSHEVQLRAERSGTGDGRVYSIAFRASDGRGGECSGVTAVTVPHGPKAPTAGAGGDLHDSFT